MAAAADECPAAAAAADTVQGWFSATWFFSIDLSENVLPQCSQARSDPPAPAAEGPGEPVDGETLEALTCMTREVEEDGDLVGGWRSLLPARLPVGTQWLLYGLGVWGSAYGSCPWCRPAAWCPPPWWLLFRLNELIGCINNGGGGGNAELWLRLLGTLSRPALPGVAHSLPVKLEAGLVSLGTAVMLLLFLLLGDFVSVLILVLLLLLLALELFAESFAWETCCRHLALRFLNQTWKKNLNYCKNKENSKVSLKN